MKLSSTIIALLIFVSCEQQASNTNNIIELGEAKTCYPVVEFEVLTDSVKIGDVYRCKIFLSDTSLYWIPKDDGTGTKRIKPTFRINGEIVKSEYDYYVYEELVTDKVVYKDLPEVREWTCGILVLHPEPYRGDIEFHLRMNYTVFN